MSVGDHGEMTAHFFVLDAVTALSGLRHQRPDAARMVARRPGLYAFYGNERSWSDLGLGPAFEGQPLYVGKAERSLNGRDVGTHFATGKTGSSTVRRSLAALLADDLQLLAVPGTCSSPMGAPTSGSRPRVTPG